MRAGRFLVFSAALIASLALAASATAATVQVKDPGDSGTASTCTLRQAIASANNDSNGGTSNCTAGSGPDQITFAPAAVAPLALNTELSITSNIDIVGPGMNSLTITGDISVRVFNVSSGGTVTISGLTATGGNPDASALGQVRGGCILNAGTLTLVGVRVTGCTALLSGNVDLTVDGGGIDSTNTLNLESSVVDHNHASASSTGASTAGEARGAGIYAEGTLTINNSTISDNDATGSATGTGLALADGGITAGVTNFSISHSTLSGNSAVASGSLGGIPPIAAGGLDVVSGTDTVELSTIAGNTAAATPPSGSSIPADGIYLEFANLALRSSTVALNGPTTGSADGANLTADDGGTATLSSSILADPQGGGKSCLIGPSGGTILSAGFNDDFSPANASCFTPPMSTDLAANPLLSAAGLASNGGSTQTIALQPTSPVIDAGSNAGDTDTTRDQRGLTRPVLFSGLSHPGNGTDIGAYEFQADCAGQPTPGGTCPTGGGTPPPPGPSSGPTGRRAAALKKCKKRKGKAHRKCVKRAKKLPV